jgi:sorbitol-specific phosphotransferase system component IIBC
MREDIEREFEEFVAHWRERRIPTIRESALAPNESKAVWLDFDNSARIFTRFRRLSNEVEVEYLEKIDRVRGEVVGALFQAKENFREKENIRKVRLLQYIVAGIIGVATLVCITLRFL